MIGFIIPIFGIVLFFVSLCIWKDSDDLDYSEFELYEDMTPEQLKKVVDEANASKHVGQVLPEESVDAKLNQGDVEMVEGAK